MPDYTNPWNEALPSGSEDADTIDNEIRQLKLDFRERLLDIIGSVTTDFADDPVIPSGYSLTELHDAISGPVSGNFRVAPSAATKSDAVSISSYSAANNYWEITGNTTLPSGSTLVFPLWLPEGSVITQIGVNFYETSGNSIQYNLSLRSREATTTTITTEDTTGDVSGVVQDSPVDHTITLGSDVTVAEDTLYWLVAVFAPVTGATIRVNGAFVNTTSA